jgi:hypothetical protein
MRPVLMIRTLRHKLRTMPRRINKQVRTIMMIISGKVLTPLIQLLPSSQKTLNMVPELQSKKLTNMELPRLFKELQVM